mmetsp:Transcript_86403/g.239603  ORF Transcript_86403/g.239603 Transcript_86403/m.239603 type:complete len:383 (-) Transcript_86403:116-1264(-)
MYPPRVLAALLLAAKHTAARSEAAAEAGALSVDGSPQLQQRPRPQEILGPSLHALFAHPSTLDDEALASAAWAHARASLTAALPLPPQLLGRHRLAPPQAMQAAEPSSDDGSAAAATAAPAPTTAEPAAPTGPALTAARVAPVVARLWGTEKAKVVSRSPSLLQSGTQPARGQTGQWPPPHGYHHHVHRSCTVFILMLVLLAVVLGALGVSFAAVRERLAAADQKQQLVTTLVGDPSEELPGGSDPFLAGQHLLQQKPPCPGSVSLAAAPAELLTRKAPLVAVRSSAPAPSPAWPFGLAVAPSANPPPHQPPSSASEPRSPLRPVLRGSGVEAPGALRPSKRLTFSGSTRAPTDSSESGGSEHFPPPRRLARAGGWSPPPAE